MARYDGEIKLVRDAITDRPALDTAVSRAILNRVAAGELPETMRLARPGAVLVVSRADRVHDVLVPVYEALGLQWDPATVGAVEDELPGVTWDDVANAILAEVETVPAELDPATLELARSLERDHLG